MKRLLGQPIRCISIAEKHNTDEEFAYFSCKAKAGAKGGPGLPIDMLGPLN